MSRTDSRNGEIKIPSVHIWAESGEMTSRLGGGGVGGACAMSVQLSAYLQKGDDKRSQGKVGGFLQLGVEFFNG